MTIACETERLIIRHLTPEDAKFILRLLNEKSFINNIADKKVRSIADAKQYLVNGPLASYNNFGFGLNAITLKNSKAPIGICGLIKRVELNQPDIGYALLPEFWGSGYALEAAQAVLQQGIRTLKLDKVLAITKLDNTASNQLLKKLGMELVSTMPLYGEVNNLYAYEKPQ